jgi:hypothetical protein
LYKRCVDQVGAPLRGADDDDVTGDNDDAAAVVVVAAGDNKRSSVEYLSRARGMLAAELKAALKETAAQGDVDGAVDARASFGEQITVVDELLSELVAEGFAAPPSSSSSGKKKKKSMKRRPAAAAAAAAAVAPANDVGMDVE